MSSRVVSATLVAWLVVAPSAAQGQTVREVFDRVSGSVVVVHTSRTEYPFMSPEAPVSVGGNGSGVLISASEVMTAAHVVQAADDVVVEFPDGVVVEAEVVASRSNQDVALLRLTQPVSVPPLPIGDSDAVAVGDQVLVVGAPFGQSHTLTVGHLSARRTTRGLFGGTSQVEFLQTDAAINPGNSGGPMFSMDGEVIGIVSHILTVSGGSQGLGYAVSANTARQMLLEEPSIWTGIEGVPVVGQLAKLLNVPPPSSGFLVQHVGEGSLAQRLGLRPGTIPVTIGGEEVLLGGDIILGAQGVYLGPELENVDELLRAVAQLPPGSTVAVLVLREGQKIELTGRIP